MKATLYDTNGKEKGKIDLPQAFSAEIREDIVARVLESKKTKQPYSPSPVAGKQYSAMGKMRHRRHVWQTSYGRGMSRVPRKVMSNRGTQFNWVGAEVAGTRGGRRAHPPRVIGNINTKKVNKKELAIATVSAISASAMEKYVKKKYETINAVKIDNLPIVAENKIVNLKTKDLINFLQIILGKELIEIALRKRKVRSGKGKMRGRKYKTTAGILFVIGRGEKMKSSIVESIQSNKLGVNDLARGGLGRLALYTEAAIKEIGERYGKGK